MSGEPPDALSMLFALHDMQGSTLFQTHRLTLAAFSYIPNVCVNTTKQSTVYVSLFSSSNPSLSGPTQDGAGTLAVTVIATETLDALQQV